MFFSSLRYVAPPAALTFCALMFPPWSVSAAISGGEGNFSRPSKSQSLSGCGLSSIRTMLFFPSAPQIFSSFNVFRSLTGDSFNKLFSVSLSSFTLGESVDGREPKSQAVIVSKFFFLNSCRPRSSTKVTPELPTRGGWCFSSFYCLFFLDSPAVLIPW